jgi:hypothetical protein
MALPNPNITPGAPPLLWSNVQEALRQVNENFDSIAATLSGGGGGLSPVNFETLDTNVSPTTDNTYSLGALGTKRWKSVFLAEYQDIPGDQSNGVYIGSAQIRGRASTIELPLNSTVVGVPIKEPFFNAIQVDDGLRIEANTAAAPWGETVNLNSGTAMQLVVSSGADSITFNNTGVTSLTGTAGQIAVSTATGNITLTNLGVLSLTNTTALPSGRTEGAGININASTGSGIKVTNTGVLSIVAGTANLTVSTDVATGVVTITNAAPAGNTFGSIIVDGDASFPILANSPGANFKVNPGYGITLTKDITTDTLTVAVNPAFDLRGSVFGDDSTVIVDAIDRVVTAAGGFIGNITGNLTGNVTGDVKGSLVGDDSTFIINGIDNTVTGTTVTAGAIRLTGGTISTTDSSGITVTAATTFNTDVIFDNDITINRQVTIGGDLIINGTTTTINSVTLSVDDKNIELGSIASPTDVTADGGGITLKGSTDKTFNYVNSTGLWTANIGVQATSFNGLAATATTASTADSVGYIGIPQSATATTATLAIGDAGKHIYVNTSSQTITIPANSSVAYPIGTAITFVAGPSASTVTIAIATDTMYLAGTGTTGSRTLAAHGMATAIKVSATAWYINGTGLT